jgi:hypothetical protein
MEHRSRGCDGFSRIFSLIALAKRIPQAGNGLEWIISVLKLELVNNQKIYTL